MSITHYCITRSDLYGGPKAAQLIHAAGESSTGSLPPNTRAIALTARDEDHLRTVETKLKDANIPHHAVWEDGVLFAIGIVPTDDLKEIRRVTSNLPLV